MQYLYQIKHLILILLYSSKQEKYSFHKENFIYNLSYIFEKKWAYYLNSFYIKKFNRLIKFNSEETIINEDLTYTIVEINNKNKNNNNNEEIINTENNNFINFF